MAKFVQCTGVTSWILFSFAIVIFNKCILDPNMYGWPFPVSLALIHSAFSSLLSFLHVRLSRRLVDPLSFPPPLSRHEYATSVLPVAALYSSYLCFSNSAYTYLSISLIQILVSTLLPLSVCLVGVLFRTDSTLRSVPSTVGMLLALFGAAVAAYGEIHLDVWGLALQVAAIASEATRLVLINVNSSNNGTFNAGPITVFYHGAPCCFAFLLVPWLLVELPALRNSSSSLYNLDLGVFGAYAICTFGLNVAVSSLAGRTPGSLTTLTAAGVARDWLLIAFSWLMTRDPVTTLNLVGYGMALLGLTFYNYVKAKEAPKKKTAAAPHVDVESSKVLGEEQLLLKCATN